MPQNFKSAQELNDYMNGNQVKNRLTTVYVLPPTATNGLHPQVQSVTFADHVWT